MSTSNECANRPIPDLPIVFEDESLIVVNKPSGLLSQPGREIHDSVLTRVKQYRNEASGPVLVHRLDMDTSGLLLLAKDRSAHRALHQQFEKRRIGKRYVARLEREPRSLGGRIQLPLRVDIDDRPRQIVCPQFGKPSTTVWHVCPEQNKHTVWLYPLTGRTHQLRVHMAHPLGLGIAIEGDRLYQHHYDVTESPLALRNGATALGRRLLLHAQYLAFDHPVSGTRQSLQVDAPFFN